MLFVALLAFLVAAALALADFTGRIHGAAGLVEVLLFASIVLLAVKGFAASAKNAHHSR